MEAAASWLSILLDASQMRSLTNLMHNCWVRAVQASPAFVSAQPGFQHCYYMGVPRPISYFGPEMFFVFVSWVSCALE